MCVELMFHFYSVVYRLPIKGGLGGDFCLYPHFMPWKQNTPHQRAPVVVLGFEHETPHLLMGESEFDTDILGRLAHC